jgi:hypothetical protein
MKSHLAVLYVLHAERRKDRHSVVKITVALRNFSFQTRQKVLQYRLLSRSEDLLTHGAKPFLRSDHSNDTWRRVQVMKLLIMQFPPTSCHFISSDQVKEDEAGRACSTNGREAEYI